jgi:hypothetical protein
MIRGEEDDSSEDDIHSFGGRYSFIPGRIRTSALVPVLVPVVRRDLHTEIPGNR